MKIKDGFVLRQVAGQGVVIATGEASKEFSGMVKLNGTGSFIWERVADVVALGTLAHLGELHRRDVRTLPEGLHHAAVEGLDGSRGGQADRKSVV